MNKIFFLPGEKQTFVTTVCFLYQYKQITMNKREQILEKWRRYEEQVNDFLVFLEQFSDEDLNTVPANGGWTALQALHHLMVIEDLGLKYTQKKLQHEPNPENIGLSHRLRSAMLQIYLRLPFAFKAPPVVSGDALPAQSTLAETAERWRQIRSAWRHFLEQLPEELLGKAVFKHPRAGRMGWLDLIAFYMTHFERHSKQALRAANQS